MLVDIWLGIGLVVMAMHGTTYAIAGDILWKENVLAFVIFEKLTGFSFACNFVYYQLIFTQSNKLIMRIRRFNQ